MSLQNRRCSWLLARAMCVGLASVVILSGCGGSDEPADQVVAQFGGLSGLKGLWRLSAEGEPEGTVVRLQGGDLQIARPCVVLDGTWAAREQLFIGELKRGGQEPWVDPKCSSAQLSDPAWLARAARYLPDGDGWRLLDREAATVAILTPGASWPKEFAGNGARVELSGSRFYPSDEERANLIELPAVPLPAGVRAPEAADLIGRWELKPPEDHRCDQPYVEFKADGRWVGHDSGDDSEGRWVLGAAGAALGTADYDDSGACGTQVGFPAPDLEGTFVDVWFLRLGRLGLDGGELVFYHPMGPELARLHRA